MFRRLKKVFIFICCLSMSLTSFPVFAMEERSYSESVSVQIEEEKLETRSPELDTLENTGEPESEADTNDENDVETNDSLEENVDESNESLVGENVEESNGSSEGENGDESNGSSEGENGDVSNGSSEDENGDVSNGSSEDENGDVSNDILEGENGNEPDEYIEDGFVVIDGATYYYENGSAVTGEKKIGGYWYYFIPSENGKMAVGWIDLPTKRVYYEKDGRICYGEKKIDGKWYYFNEISGQMRIGWQYIADKEKKVYYGPDGVMCYGEKKIDNKWYYFNTVTGKMQTGWYNLPEKRVYYGSDGAMRYGEQKINNKWYYFNTVTGKMQTGWYNLPEKRVYYGSDGAMRYGEQKINNKWYYFNTVTGKMQTGWYNLPGKKVYYGSDGAMVYGKQVIGGNTYYFHTVTGALLGSSEMAAKAQQYTSSTKWLLLVDTTTNKVGIYNGSKSKWVEQKYWDCTTGAKSTPTVKGSFTVQAKGKSFGDGYTCWYYTQFYGNYLFHSVLYYPGSMTRIKDGRLGINASHGCVRLSLENAKWIYDNIPRGTKVVIY